jgi:hypothetical protein
MFTMYTYWKIRFVKRGLIISSLRDEWIWGHVIIFYRHFIPTGWAFRNLYPIGLFIKHYTRMGWAKMKLFPVGFFINITPLRDEHNWIASRQEINKQLPLECSKTIFIPTGWAFRNLHPLGLIIKHYTSIGWAKMKSFPVGLFINITPLRDGHYWIASRREINKQLPLKRSKTIFIPQGNA